MRELAAWFLTFIHVPEPNRPLQCFSPDDYKEVMKALQSKKAKAQAVRNRGADLEYIVHWEWINMEFKSGPQGAGIIAEPIPPSSGRNLTLSDIRIAVEDIKRLWPPKATDLVQPSDCPPESERPIKRRTRKKPSPKEEEMIRMLREAFPSGIPHSMGQKTILDTLTANWKGPGAFSSLSTMRRHLLS
jgi:hypothetical protein